MTDYSGLPAVEAEVNFVLRTGTPLVSDYRDPAKSYRPMESRRVRIADARPIRAQLDLETNGFILLDSPCAIPNALDEEWMRAHYLPQIRDLVEALAPKADVVFPLDLMVRVSPASADKPLRANDRAHAVRPGAMAHLDFTCNSVWPRVERAQRAGTVPDRRFRRAAVYQTWRVLSEPPHDFPFAVTDYRSTRPGQYLPILNILGPPEIEENLMETGVVTFGDYDWCYFSDIRRDELLVFKGYDTCVGESRNVFHSAFEDTTHAGRTNPRISVEARCIALWE